MLNNPEEVAGILRGSMLDGRPVTSVELPGEAALALAVPCGSDEVLTAWQCLHDALEQTGRWPVVAAGWSGPVGPDLFDRFPYDHGAGADTSIHGIITRAEAIVPAAVIADLARADDAWDISEQLEPFELANTKALVGDAPRVDEVRHALGAKLTHANVDRWLLDWEEARGASRDGENHLEWFEPTGLDTAVVLLPTVHGWQTPAFMSFFGAEGPGGAEKLIAILRSWHERYGAELVAHFGTMLEFAVARPPRSLDEAWQLAREQELVAQCTTVSPGVPLRQHARTLVGRPSWFLHERP